MTEKDAVVEVKICKDCGKEFEFKQGERDFYAEKGFVEPLRCKDCRKARKQKSKNGKVEVKSEVKTEVNK